MHLKSRFSQGCLYLTVFSLLTLICGSAVFAMGKNEPTLYDRLGGVYNIATVVDDFVERLYVNDTLNANPRIKEAREKVPKAGLKYQVTSFICEAIGGPQRYAGRTMREAHRNLNITEKEWQAMAADFKATLDKFNVPEREQKELFDKVESVKEDILMSTARERERPVSLPPMRGY